MASAKRRPGQASGPWGWENSRKWCHGQPQLGAIEIGCYTDLPELWMDPVDVGPYTILVPLLLTDTETMVRRMGQPRMGLVLRVKQYLGEHPNEYVDPAWQQLDRKNYHAPPPGRNWPRSSRLLWGSGFGRAGSLSLLRKRVILHPA
jgi:hypothetical protein